MKRRTQFLIIAAAALLIGGSAALYGWLFADLPSLDAIEQGMALPSTRIYDRHGRLLYEMLAADATGGLHRVVPLEQMPQHLRDATIATEDANFYNNPGVDPTGILRALLINLQGGEVVSGGSTITQQVARNLLMDPEARAERTLRRKLREVILAVRLSQTRTKDEILALYLNQSYYGNLAYGVEAAARAYFGRGVEELDLAQAALLAGLPQAPAIYDPLTNPEKAKARQRVVLGLMVKHGYIAQAKADQAAAEPLQFAATPFPIEAPHFVAAVWEQLQRGYPEPLYAGGLDVITTLDLDWQHAARRIARYHLGELNTPTRTEPAHNAHNAALVAMDPHTGQVLAMLGSPDYFDPRISGAVNLAVAPRQPGSALKPFTYAAAFDPERPDPWAPATVIFDVRTAFVTKKLESFVPANFSLSEHGPVRVRTALASSFNIPAVITLDHIGLKTFSKLLSTVGISTLTNPDRFDLAVTLGGGEVRLLELTAAYSALANGGHRTHPQMLLEVRDHQSDAVLYSWEPHDEPGAQVIDSRVAWLITDILSDNHARIPSFGEHSILNLSRPAAAKTGTTTDFRDNWTMGYTPNLAVGVWVGNASNAPMVKVTGISGAGPIWHDFMETVLRGKPALSFERPEGLVRAEVCALSGLLPTEDCERRVVDWFIKGTVPTEYDTWHQRFTIDAQTGLLADDSTPPARRVERVYLVLPPELRPWAYDEGIPEPPSAAAIEAADAGAALRLTSPDPYSVYRLSPVTPEETQRILVRAVAPPDTQEITFHLNGEPLATLDAPPWEMWWALQRGDWELSARAALVDGSVQESAPVTLTVHGFYDVPSP